MSSTPILKSMTLRGVIFDPPLFCAPMANLTHSAFRRLLADFGGYGALFTEMLAAKTILGENPLKSPWLKRRPTEGKVFYQLLVTDPTRLPEIVARLSIVRPDGLDLNCSCGAPSVCRQGGGVALFDDIERMARTIRTLRKCFSGPLTVKIRLGRRAYYWFAHLLERVRVMDDEGCDAIILHPRFLEDKFKRPTQDEVYGKLAEQTRLPIIANGDIAGPADVAGRAATFSRVAGLMIGRHAAARPWFFAKWHNPAFEVDPAEVFQRLCGYLEEDFPPEIAVRRLKIWVPYFAANFLFGHTLFKAVHGAPDWDTAVKRGIAFLSTNPERVETISVSGL